MCAVVCRACRVLCGAHGVYLVCRLFCCACVVSLRLCVSCPCVCVCAVCLVFVCVSFFALCVRVLIVCVVRAMRALLFVYFSVRMSCESCVSSRFFCVCCIICVGRVSRKGGRRRLLGGAQGGWQDGWAGIGVAFVSPSSKLHDGGGSKVSARMRACACRALEFGRGARSASCVVCRVSSVDLWDCRGGRGALSHAKGATLWSEVHVERPAARVHF